MMRNTRKMVDQYLSLGKIEEAERYMEEATDYWRKRGKKGGDKDFHRLRGADI